MTKHGMLWIGFLLVGTLALRSETTDFVEDVEYIYITAKPNLQIRESAGTKFKEIGNVPYGTKVQILDKNGPSETIGGKSGKWVKIAQLSSGESGGWIFSGFTSPVPSDFETQGVIIFPISNSNPIETSYHFIQSLANPNFPFDVYDPNEVKISLNRDCQSTETKQKHDGCFLATCGLGSGQTSFNGIYRKKGKNRFLLSGTGTESWQSTMTPSDIKVKGAILEIHTETNYKLKATIKGLGQCFGGTAPIVWSEYLHIDL